VNQSHFARLGSRPRCARRAATRRGCGVLMRSRFPFQVSALISAAAAVAWPLFAAAGQLAVTDYAFTVAPTSNYANQNLTVLTNGVSQVTVWPGTADTSQVVGWFDVNPGVQFNFTGGRSISEVTIWSANSKGSAGIWLPVTVTISSGTYSKTLTVTPPTGSGTTTPLTITGISGAADSFTITANRSTASSPSGWTMFSEVQFFGTGAKAANADALNLATSWTGTQAPVSTDVVLFNTTFSSTTALDTGTAVDWAGLKATGGSGTLTIDPSSSASRLGIGSSGIDLSGTGRSVRVTDLRLTGSTTQPWSIAAGRSLTIGADSLAQDVGASPVLSGSGTLVKEGAATGLALGSLASFTGTLSVQAGSLATSAASQLTGNYAVSLAAGGTLQLGGNDTLPASMNTGDGSLQILASNTLSITNTSARTVDRVFTGTGVVTKTGTGVLTLSGVSSHSGGTWIAGGAGSNGILRVGSSLALGTGTVTISGSNAGTGSVLDLNGATIANPIVIQALGSGLADTGALQNMNTSTAAVVNGPVVIGGGSYVGGDGSIAFNGIISGGTSIYYSLFKQGTGTWTFANSANTFDGFYYQIGGVTEVTKLANAGEASSLGRVAGANNLFVFGYVGSGGGTLRYVGPDASTSDKAFSLRGATAATNNVIEAAGTSAAATLTLTGPLSAGAAGSYAATLTGTNSGVNIYSGTIGNGSGSVALVKQGSTTWALTGANSYTGVTTVSSGTLKVGNGGSAGVLGGGGVSVAGAATLAFDRSDSSLIVADLISGSGAVIQIGSGTTSLTGANTHTSTTEIAAGTLRIGNGGAAGTLGSGGVAIASAGMLAFNRSDSFTVANAISGSGAVVKQAGGTLTLTGASTYTGGTRLTAGTLIVGSDQALGTGTVAFAAGTLQTARNVLVPIAVESSGTLAIVGAGVDLTANFLGSGTLTKTGTGTLTLSGPASTFSGSLVIAGGAGANSIVRAGTTAAFGTGTVTILGTGGNTGSTFDLNGQSLDNALVIGLGNSGVGNAGALMNSNPAVPATLSGAVSLGGEIYVGGAGSIAFTGLISGSVNPANDYSLYKDGAGTWTFANVANTFDGYYYQVGGATEVTKLANLNEPSSLGRATTAGRNRVVFGSSGSGGGTLRFIGSAASTGDREFVMSGGTAASSTVIEASGASSVATLMLTGNLSATRAGTYAATLGGTNAGVNVYAGTIGNGSATSVALVKDGSTTWALTAANTYTGSTTISAGTLQIGNGGTVGELGGTGSVANDGVLAVNRMNAFSFSRAITGGGAFHQLGTGTTTLAGSNTYTGGAVINGGVLALGSAAALGTAGTISFGGGTLQYSSSNTTDYSGRFSTAASQQVAIDTNGQNVALGSNLTSSGGTFTKHGAGTLTLTGINTYSGLTAISAGRLIGSATSLPGAITNAAELEFAQPSAGTFSSAITGTGALTKTGGGNLILSGSSTYTGATSVAAGRLSVDGILGDSPIAVLAAAELGGSGSIAGPVSVAAGGTLSPGNSIASLATGTASFAAAATFAYEVDSADPLSLGAAADLLVVGGNLDLDPGNGTLLTFTDLNSSPAPFVEDTTIFSLINYSGSWNGGLFTYGGTPLADGSQFQAGSQWWEIDYNSSTGGDNFTSDYLPSSSFVTVTAVPEPGTLALMSIGAGLAVIAFRRNSGRATG
jgi:fibronectin-binding autotransporter adhesin